MKQTAVEWLAVELWEKFEMRGDGLLYDDILTKAKEKEKQQGYSEEEVLNIVFKIYDEMGISISEETALLQFKNK